MGRAKRIWLPDYFFHVVCRGNRRDPLFYEENDFHEFFYILTEIYEKYPLQLVSYCLMTNHFHLQVRSTEESISKIMSLLNKRYANYFNTKYGLTGHVFEKRFFSDIISDPLGMLEVSRYIHQNPLKAKMVTSPELYPYSSMYYYTNSDIDPPPFLDTTILLNYFPESLDERRQRFIEYTMKAE
ncbi:transposase [Anaerobacillus alkaliphilus]|uniref:Transposase n=1 Tax=Anaerobacillus alkaliphilus TaxID=1548597 RepID=A0A4Q0VUV8_9BACI|nr:transposase [Anaerobacillus alkaliphilus]RXJ02204.1 transposase [Anaerobacillus alkaliphilus]